MYGPFQFGGADFKHRRNFPGRGFAQARSLLAVLVLERLFGVEEAVGDLVEEPEKATA